MAKSYSDKLRDPRWQKRRLETLNRDSFSCRYCGDKESELQVHHLKYSGDPWDTELEDLVTTCVHCHKVIEASKKFFSLDLIFSVIKKVMWIGKVDGSTNYRMTMLFFSPQGVRCFVVADLDSGGEVYFGYAEMFATVENVITEFKAIKNPVENAETIH